MRLSSGKRDKENGFGEKKKRHFKADHACKLARKMHAMVGNKPQPLPNASVEMSGHESFILPRAKFKDSKRYFFSVFTKIFKTINWFIVLS